MYPANAGSPSTTTSSETAIDATSIAITELGNLKDAPNQVTLEDDTSFEVVVYTEKSAASGAGTITVSRSGAGHEGTAKVWPAGTIVANYPTAYTFDTIKANIEDLAATMPVKAAGSDIITGTDDEKFLTSKALKDAAAKRSIFLSLAGGWTGTTLPDGGFLTTETSTNKVNFRGTKFVAAATDANHEFGCIMPGNYDGGTITAKAVLFVPTSEDASDHTIIFGLQGVAFADGDAGDTAYGTAQEVTITASASLAGKVKISSESSAITIANSPAANKWTQFRCYRKGDDTYTGDVTLLGWIISYGITKYSDT
jgi:hypothetical protein